MSQEPVTIKMTANMQGSPDGTKVLGYAAGKEYTFSSAAGADLARVFVEELGAASYVVEVAPEAKQQAAPAENKRAAKPRAKRRARRK